MTVGTVRTPDFLLNNDFVPNTTGLITAAMVQDLAESAFSIPLSPNGVRTAAYTAQLNDRGTVVPFNVVSGAATLTIPQFSSVPFALGNALGILWVNGAAVQPSFAAGTGVTIVPVPSLTARAAGSIAWAWQYSQNVWYTMGDLT